ncbi:MAG: response regulator [Eubacterium sp.]|nr:response regulator [Eubacterium sp.]
MFRIVVADDEGIMRESIKNNLESNFGQKLEVRTVKSGREAIEECLNFRPDIVFMDIQMPGISGIQAIKEIQKFNKSIRFIIITAYDRFSYAQEAISLGVVEYIMKPVTKKKIMDVAIKVMNQIDEERKKNSDDLKVREKLEIVVPMIESAFINNILQGSDTGKGREYLNMLDVQEEYGYIVVLEFGDDFEDGVLTNAMGSNVRLSKQYDNLKESIKAFFDSIVGPIMGNRVVIYVPIKEGQLEYDRRVEIITRIRSMILNLEDTMEMKFRAGIGEVKYIEDSYESYTEAIRSLHRSNKHIVHAEDISVAEDMTQDVSNVMDLEQKYIQCCMKGGVETALIFADSLIEALKDIETISFGEKKTRVYELIVRLEQQCQDIGIIKYEIRSHAEYLNDIVEISNMQELGVWLQDKTKRLCNDIVSFRTDSGNGAIGKSISYINENFSRDLSLDDVARFVDISPYYFSKLFKQEMGENFVEYLTKYRVAQAKTFLANESLSIKEICGMVGYSDPNYFSRIFKKYEGVTPTEYRNGEG